MNYYYQMNNTSLLKKIKIDYINEEKCHVETHDIQEKNQTDITYLDGILEHPFIDSLESNTYPLKATNVNIVLYRLNKFNEIDYIEYYLLNGKFLSITTSYDSDYDIESIPLHGKKRLKGYLTVNDAIYWHFT